MTRATLLHVLDNTSALGPAEVRELEQLAQAFPYCQTAHLLLAKAAHDQGTMLAGQRLRRAATYAADRTLLRRLIEDVEPTKAPAVEPSSPESVAAAPPIPETVAPVPPVETMVELATAEPAAEPIERLPALEAIEAVTEPNPVIKPATEPVVAPEEGPLNASLPAEAPEVVALPVPPAADSALLLDVEGVDISSAEPTPYYSSEAEPETEENLPAQAPAIRPPVEIGEARFEFGLAEPPPPAVPTYELPGLVDEWAAAAVTLSMGSLESLLEIPASPGAAKATIAAAFTPTAFTGDDTVGYAFGESSRLGFSMQLLNLLTDSAAPIEYAPELAVSALPPASALPPVGAFFEPDPLLLDYWATHRPPAPAVPSSLDLINNFLRRQPRLTRPAMLPPAANTQADLSMRSTRAESDLASESLARILVRQGKTARAIEIYEKLMVKQPEKMAYFASQIQQLQPPA